MVWPPPYVCVARVPVLPAAAVKPLSVQNPLAAVSLRSSAGCEGCDARARLRAGSSP
jgi:hypothetical protein